VIRVDPGSTALAFASDTRVLSWGSGKKPCLPAGSLLCSREGNSELFLPLLITRPDRHLVLFLSASVTTLVGDPRPNSLSPMRFHLLFFPIGRLICTTFSWSAAALFSLRERYLDLACMRVFSPSNPWFPARFAISCLWRFAEDFLSDGPDAGFLPPSRAAAAAARSLPSGAPVRMTIMRTTCFRSRFLPNPPHCEPLAPGCCLYSSRSIRLLDIDAGLGAARSSRLSLTDLWTRKHTLGTDRVSGPDVARIRFYRPPLTSSKAPQGKP